MACLEEDPVQTRNFLGLSFLRKKNRISEMKMNYVFFVFCMSGIYITVSPSLSRMCFDEESI